MRRGRCESRSDDHGREALALLDSLKGNVAWHFASLRGPPWTPSSSWTPSTPSPVRLLRGAWLLRRSIWQRKSDSVVPGLVAAYGRTTAPTKLGLAGVVFVSRSVNIPSVELISNTIKLAAA